MGLGATAQHEARPTWRRHSLLKLTWLGGRRAGYSEWVMVISREQGRLLDGRYRLLALLGRGGMGTVWHARDELLDRDVAVKEVLAPSELSDDEREILCQRTMREARAAARLSHPNVVTVYDVVEEGGCPWIIMEFVQSRSLAQIAREDGPLPPRRVAEIGLQLLAALQVAHTAGILHRDVKPGNVLLRQDGRVVLTDFGIATLEGDPSLTKSGMLLGAPAYIAPERVRGHQGGPESDLWSLAATLYTAVEGRPPYDCGAAMATLTAVVTEEPAAPSLAGPLWPVLQEMLRKDPAERIGAVDAQRLLRQVASTAESTAEEVRSAPTVAAPAVDAAASMERVERTRVLPLPQTGPDPALAAVTPSASESETGIEEKETEAGPVAQVQKRAGRRPPVLLAGLAVLVVLAGALLGWGALRPEGSRTVRPPTVEPQESAPAATQPTDETPGVATSPNTGTTAESPASPAPETADPSAVLPAGFRWHHDDTGFSVAVPNEWDMDTEGQRVYFREPGGSRFLLIDQTNDPKDDPVKDWQEQESYRRSRYADYQRIHIVPVDYYQKAADWEFTYTGRNGRVHVLNRGVVTGDDQAYGMYWSTPDSQWQESLRYFEVFTETFRPAS
jgi:eukaryotic-like serine/threonine-protein kinase